MVTVQDLNGNSGGIASKPQPALNTLPSELRRLIVSHLAPERGTLLPGCKKHLKSANLAHSCLREWVPEYMFRDMALMHVLVGMSSHLECFTVESCNQKLLKLVKHVNVQVPPAVRWEIGSDNPFAHHLEEATMQRLWSKFRIASASEMTDQQRQYGDDFYRAIVEPFTDNRSWYRLLRSAESSWNQVFVRFKNLDTISVGCCEIAHQPSPTYTHTFVRQHGRDVVSEPEPRYVEDSAVNMAWASSVVLKTAPPWVRHLQIYMANMDNFNSFATVNRLLSLSHRRSLQPHLLNTTSLCLTIKGIAGTHGSSDWEGDTGSAAYVRHWTSALNNLRELRHLELRDAMEIDSELQFSDMEMSDSKGTILDWMLPNLTLKKLRTLQLSGFSLDEATIPDTFPDIWPCLETIALEDITLIMRVDELVVFDDEHLEHLRGASWPHACSWLLSHTMMSRVKLIRPISKINDDETLTLHDKYVESIAELHRVDLEI